MQQLNGIHFVLTPDCVNLLGVTDFSGSGIQALSAQLANILGADVLALEWGADRWQQRFELDGRLYLLYMESVCEAVWIEPCKESDFSYLISQLKLVGAELTEGNETAF
ncbi:DUF3630 family protein [Bowmanella yangjiangensis]|uniref:DUF3630 family protein n=1 Tax=Bowmanella yangjiangensis TaxID=2811230 RepID=A0ABS3CUL7_9ALTE|nr:DUF3630 family protein [Bowmanella yangjiangensis]MBN7820808.1 DUF3630 family protein [Bowmanella yangjiangensis]